MTAPVGPIIASPTSGAVVLSIPAASGPATNGYMLGADKQKLDQLNYPLITTFVSGDTWTIAGVVAPKTGLNASYSGNLNSFGITMAGHLATNAGLSGTFIVNFVGAGNGRLNLSPAANNKIESTYYGGVAGRILFPSNGLYLLNWYWNGSNYYWKVTPMS